MAPRVRVGPRRETGLQERCLDRQNDVSIPAAGVTNEPTISTAVTLASITEAAGRTLTVSSAGNLAVTGACTVNGTANIAGTASCGSIAGTGTVNFTGTAVQNVPGGTYQNLGVTNAAGVNLSASVTVNGVLNLAGGDLNTGANLLTIGTGGSVTRTSGAVDRGRSKSCSAVRERSHIRLELQERSRRSMQL